ncbi:MAG: hypothetical protein HC893_00080 [Chloroflexaceae bacterium]|nr:hypothetical protein [Chloroflexaceae bacterium]
MVPIIDLAREARRELDLTQEAQRREAERRQREQEVQRLMDLQSGMQCWFPRLHEYAHYECRAGAAYAVLVADTGHEILISREVDRHSCNQYIWEVEIRWRGDSLWTNQWYQHGGSETEAHVLVWIVDRLMGKAEYDDIPF